MMFKKHLEHHYLCVFIRKCWFSLQLEFHQMGIKGNLKLQELFRPRCGMEWSEYVGTNNLGDTDLANANSRLTRGFSSDLYHRW